MSIFAKFQTVRSSALAAVEKLGWFGPLLARVTVGLEFISTGWGKLHDLDSVTAFFTRLNIPAPGASATLVATTELAGGVLLLVGLFTRLAALPLATTMIVAILTAKRADIDGLTTLVGFEEFMYLAFFVWLALAGAGAISLDRLAARRLERAKAPTAAGRAPQPASAAG